MWASLLTLLAMVGVVLVGVLDCFHGPHCPLGAEMRRDELIAHSSRIYLVKVIQDDRSSQARLKILETLKYNPLRRLSLKLCKLISKPVAVPDVEDLVLEASVRKSDLQQTDFDYHRSAAFWKKGETLHSPGLFCDSTPDHFVKGRVYLFFPDYWVSRYSAELIRDKEKDKWYQYVKNY